LLTFTGLNYGHDPNQPLVLTNVTFQLDSADVEPVPVEVTSNTASYLVTYPGYWQYTIDKDSFSWLPYSTNIVTDNEYGHFETQITQNWLSFSAFHNQAG